MILEKFKVYLIGIAVVAGVLLVWNARGWYEDAKTKSALETVITEGNKQTLIDRAITRSSIKEQDNVDKTFENIRGGNFTITNVIVRWNKANAAANQAGIT